MEKNMGNTDKLIRLIIAALIAFLCYNESINGTLAVVLLIVATVFVITSFISICPLYTILGINTCSIKK
jgi:hypothetical protein